MFSTITCWPSISLNRGVMISGEVMLGLAGVDLIYLRVQAMLCAADRVTAREKP